jgi:hypothetical protein
MNGEETKTKKKVVKTSNVKIMKKTELKPKLTVVDEMK